MSGEEEEFEEIEETEEAGLAKFGERAIRAPRGGAFERLLCQHLVLSVTSDPIGSILHTCRAALSLPESMAKQLEIDKAKVSDILTVALNFQQTKENKDDVIGEHYSLHWSFLELGEEGFQRFIAPWLTTTITWLVPYEMANSPEMEEYNKRPLWERFFHGCRRLTPPSFHGLLSAFVSWAYPFVEELNNKVSSQVSPTTYQEILSMFTKFKEKEAEE